MKYFKIIIFIIFYSSLAFTANPNGSGQLSCSDIDYNADVAFGELSKQLTYRQWNRLNNPRKIVNFISNRIKILGKKQHRKIIKRYTRSFPKRFGFDESFNYPIPQELLGFENENCKVELYLVWDKSQRPRPFRVNKQLWPKLRPKDRLYHVFHMLIYQHYFKKGIKDSQQVRAMMSFLISDQVDGSDQRIKKEELFMIIRPLFL